MKDKACHPQSFWDIYKAINFNRGKSFDCSWCDGKCKLKWKKQDKSFGARVLSWFLWMSPAIILIALVATQNMSALHAIILIIAFHFAAMYFIINSWRLIIKQVKTGKSKSKKIPVKKTAKKIVKKKKVTKKKK